MVESTKYKWGYEIILANTENYSGRSLIILSGEQTPLVYHKKQDKTLFILQGTVQLDIEGKKRLMKEGDTYHISPKIVYKIVALGTDATIIEIGTKLENDTVVVEE